MRKRENKKTVQILPGVGRSLDQDRSSANPKPKGNDIMSKHIADNSVTLKDTCEVSQRIYQGLKFDYLIPISELEENEFNHKLYKNYGSQKNIDYIIIEKFYQMVKKYNEKYYKYRNK